MAEIPKLKRPVHMRGAYQAMIVEVCEGNGDTIPYQIVGYVISDTGEVLGKISRNWEYQDSLEK